MTELKYKVGDRVTVNLLGLEDDRDYRDEPVDMRGLCTVVEVEAGSNYNYRVKSDYTGDFSKYSEHHLDPAPESATVKFDRATVAHIAETVERIDQTAGGNNSAALHGIHSYLGGLLEGINLQ